MSYPRLRILRAGLLVFFPLMPLFGCELDEVGLAEPDDVAVVEAYIMIGDGPDKVSAFLHWTLGTRPARDLLDREVIMVREDGLRIPLFPEEVGDCVLPGIVDVVEGICYTPGFNVEGLFQPGTQVQLEVLLDDDDLLQSNTHIPEAISFISPIVRNQCALAPGEALEFVWNRSPGVWAYSAETEIKGLREALAQDGIQIETDSVALQGLAVSDADTTLVFPMEFGIFERFDLEQELAEALQVGLPEGADADVVIGAVDQNYVNWLRGGNFNPSGPVRVSSIRGPGVGVFGSVFRRTILVRGGAPSYFPGGLLPSCLLPAPP
jgi:hypothetical protein